MPTLANVYRARMLHWQARGESVGVGPSVKRPENTYQSS